jgi:hypothetical protein
MRQVVLEGISIEDSRVIVESPAVMKEPRPRVSVICPNVVSTVVFEDQSRPPPPGELPGIIVQALSFFSTLHKKEKTSLSRFFRT